MSAEATIQTVQTVRSLHAESASDYAALIRSCAENGEPIIDYGRVHTGLGYRPPGGGVHIDPPSGVIEHYVEDMTVRVAAGTTLSELAAVLAEHQQYLPLDASDDMTVAEAVTHHAFGPLRTSQGTMRDLLLGLHYVNATGQIIEVGGRTVKNVAGYDMTRLMVGSMNTLALITQVVLRTASLPPQVTQVRIDGMNPGRLDPLMTSLLISDAAPYHMQWCYEHGAAVLHLAYADTPAGCDVRYQALVDWLRTEHLSDSRCTRQDVDFATDHRDRGSRNTWQHDCAATVRVIVPPALTGRVLEQLAAWDDAPQHLTALPSCGVIHVGGAMNVDAARQLDAAIRTWIQPHGGSHLWFNRPEHTETIEPFAPEPADLAPQIKLKNTLDPNNLFNPGRLFV